MARQPGKYLSIFIPEAMLNDIQDFRFRSRVGSRAEALRMLVNYGLLNDLSDMPLPSEATPKPKRKRAHK